jgi:hypothetical protein
MEMFLTVAALSLIGLVVSVVLFAAATERERERVGDTPAVMVTPAAARFFVDREAVDTRQVPLDALLLQIERHVRLEHAAAESPTRRPRIAHSRPCPRSFTEEAARRPRSTIRISDRAHRGAGP